MVQGDVMSLRNRLVLPVILSALAVLAACGGSGTTTGTPPPTGGFTDANLNGTYVFSVTGSDAAGGLITIVGTFIANGSGGISGGVIDTTGTTNGPAPGQAITSGRYAVGPDGRPGSQNGVLTLMTSVQTYGFDFVLYSSEHGLMTEFDGNGSASGTLDLQANVTQANIDGQSYAFNLTGASGVGTVLCLVQTPGGPIPLETVGAFTLDNSGNMSAGVQDFNNNCSSAGDTGLALTGSVSLATSPGRAALTALGTTYNFDVFPVDATHLKFIETDAAPFLSGDVFTQTSSIPSPMVLSAGGYDHNAGLPFAFAGLLITDGNGNITTSSVEDINEGGTATEVTAGITGTYAAVTGGRSVITFTGGFFNGNNGLACSGCQFAAYPSSGGVLLLEIDGAGLTDGSAFAQGNNPALASAQGYGMNLSGSTSSSEEDDIAEFTNNSGTLGPGVIDFNDQGTTSFGKKYSATYAADTTVSGRGVVTPTTNAYNMVTYGIDSSTQVIVSTDPSFVGVGFLAEQNASEKSNAAMSHLAVLRAHLAGRNAVKKPSGN